MTPEQIQKLKELRNALSCWQDDYDPTEDKEQYDMFGAAVDAVVRLEAAEAELARRDREAGEPLLKCSTRITAAPPAALPDYFAELVAKARQSAEKAMISYPQPNYVLLKVAEEAGEVVQAGVHYAEGRETWEALEGEVVQTIAMLYRLVIEGDQVNGVIPPALSAQDIGVEE